eukprot:TRINITY_DN2941_c0_g1_i2.p1 TRINITY_DN2941_c0_g1~~TRINITY_DN2941_c0_g1_i2.p1  ORF type:complete len:219 (+),score=8.40 TRINITY_DN2941_c0_g1_i2:224-880(+)
MAFRANPLSLSIPEGEMEAWLKHSGYLQESKVSEPGNNIGVENAKGVITAFENVGKLLRINPLEKVGVEDVCKTAAPWTPEFFGKPDSYSWPSSISELESRVHLNTSRFAPNYLRLSLFILACFLYNMPLALLGVASIFATWDLLRICSNRYGIHNHVLLFKALLLIANIVTIILSVYCKVAMAFCGAGIFSFTGKAFVCLSFGNYSILIYQTDTLCL